MDCYACGEYGHKFNECSQRDPSVKYYKRKNKRKIIQARYNKSQEKLREQEAEDKKWIEVYMPNKNKILLNKDKIKNIIIHAISHSFTLTTTNNISISMYYHKGTITSYGDGPLGRCIKNMSVDKFLSFVAMKGAFHNLSYKVNDDDISSMIFELGKNGFIMVYESELDGEDEYYLCNEKIMISNICNGNYNSIIDMSYKKLICEHYNIMINGYNPDANNIEGSINFIYE